MSNRPRRRRPANQRRRLRSAALTAAAVAGCTCSPDYRHLGPGHVELAHDDDCPLADHPGHALLIAPSWQPRHPTGDTRR